MSYALTHPEKVKHTRQQQRQSKHHPTQQTHNVPPARQIVAGTDCKPMGSSSG